MEKTDEHDVKFVYICGYEASHFGSESEIGRYAKYAAYLRLLD